MLSRAISQRLETSPASYKHLTAPLATTKMDYRAVSSRWWVLILRWSQGPRTHRNTPKCLVQGWLLWTLPIRWLLHICNYKMEWAIKFSHSNRLCKQIATHTRHPSHSRCNRPRLSPCRQKGLKNCSSRSNTHATFDRKSKYGSTLVWIHAWPIFC